MTFTLQYGSEGWELIVGTEHYFYPNLAKALKKVRLLLESPPQEGSHESAGS